MKISVAIPLKKSTVLTLKPRMSGTRTVAPNIAMTCWMQSRVVWGQGRRSSGKYVTSWSAVRAAVVAVAIRAFPPTHDMTSWRSWDVSRMNLLAAAASFPPERLRGPGEREHGVEQHRGPPRAVLGRRPLRRVVAEAVLTRH